MLKLRSELENTDEASLKAFDFELKSFDWKKYLDNYCLGTRHYLLKNKPETLDSSRKHLKRLKYLHYFVQCLFAFIIYWIFKCYIWIICINCFTNPRTLLLHLWLIFIKEIKYRWIDFNNPIVYYYFYLWTFKSKVYKINRFREISRSL